MLEFDSVELVVQTILISLGMFLVLRTLTKSAQVSEFDDLGFLNIMMMFNFALVFFLYLKDIFPEEGLIEVLVTIGSFYIGIFVTARIFNLKRRFPSMRDELISTAREDCASTMLLMSILLFVIAGSFFAVLQIDTSDPDQRLIISKNFRVFDIMRSGAATIFLVILFVRVFGLKQKKAKWLFSPYILISIFSGSKGVFLSILHYFLLMKGVLRGKLKSLEDFIWLIPVGIASLLFGAVVLLIYYGDLMLALRLMAVRLFLNGDVYLMSYVTAQYQDLFGKYDAIPYILHPFLKLIGLEGYDYPVGNALSELVTGAPDFGPNAHLSIVYLIFTRGSLVLSGILCFLTGAFVILLKMFSHYLLMQKNLPPIWRMSLFFAFFPCASLFIDLGVFEQRVISVVMVLILLSLVYEVMGGRYRRKIKAVA
jgi:hypothetical protein